MGLRKQTIVPQKKENIMNTKNTFAISQPFPSWGIIVYSIILYRHLYLQILLLYLYSYSIIQYVRAKPTWFVYGSFLGFLGLGFVNKRGFILIDQDEKVPPIVCARDSRSSHNKLKLIHNDLVVVSCF